MKTLDEFNRDRTLEHNKVAQSLHRPRRNGIACPECGSEMWDSLPSFTLTSNPPQKNVHCGNCSYKGYRVA